MDLTPRRPELAGTCERAVNELVSADPSLTKVAGWYIDMVWGSREHFWAVDPDGKIVDPTVEQFPTGHIPSLRQYVPYEGFYPCPGCGILIECERREDAGGFCCGACYGSVVGIYSGICECVEPKKGA